MKTCPNCGTQVADEAVFCNNCGTNVANVDSAAAAVDNAAKAVDQAASQALNNAGPAPVQNFQPQFNQAGFQGQPYVAKADPTDHTAEFDPRDIADNKLFAVLPYFTFIFGVIAALLVKESPFTRFHAKNAIRIEIATILACIPCIIPVLGWLVTGVLMVILVIIQIIAIVNCFQGKAKDLPILGSIGFHK